MDLFVELHFPAHYWSVAPSAIHVTVGQSPSRAAPTDHTPLERCKLSWPLEHRIRKQFLPDLLRETKPLPTPAFSWDSAKEVASTCDCDWLTAIRALIKCKGDQNRASDEIVREQLKMAERAAASRLNSSKQQPIAQATSGSTKSKRADSKKDKQKKKKKPKVAASPPGATAASSAITSIAPSAARSTEECEVMSACGVSLWVAQRGLAMCHGDKDSAMDLLWDEDTVADLTAEEATSTAAEPFSKHTLSSTDSFSSSISFTADTAGPQSDEDRLLALLAEHNYLVRLLRFIKGKIHSIHSTCTLCEKQLQYAGLNLSVCQSSLCRMSYESMGVGFDIGAAIAGSPVLTDLYISMLASAVSGSHLPFSKPLTVTGTGKDGVEKSFLLAASAPAGAGPASDEKEQGPAIDYNKLMETIHRLPPVAQMVEDIRAGTFVEKMNQLDVLICHCCVGCSRAARHTCASCRRPSASYRCPLPSSSSC